MSKSRPIVVPVTGSVLRTSETRPTSRGKSNTTEEEIRIAAPPLLVVAGGTAEEARPIRLFQEFHCFSLAFWATIERV
jgi:hypothetical protein